MIKRLIIVMKLIGNDEGTNPVSTAKREGNRRNPLNWSQPDTRTNLMLDRGYTGHEHLDGAHIINMNGRMYDPIIGRMLSPDPVLQNPYSTQNYNRYSYVMNNPLKYTDPTGYRMSFQELSYFENQRVQSGGGDYRGYMFGANIDVPDSDGFIMWNSWIDSGVSGLVNFTDYQSGIENGVSFKSYDSGDKDYVVAKYSAIANNGLQGEWIPLMSTDPLEKGYTFLLNGVVANSGGNIDVYIWDKGYEGDVGHTAIRIGDKVYGYYPTDVDGDGQYTKADLKNSPGEMHINSISEFNSYYCGNGINAYTISLNGQQYNALLNNLNAVAQNPGYYSLGGNNCTSIAMQCLSNAGFDIGLNHMGMNVSRKVSPSSFGFILQYNGGVSNSYHFVVP
ncbi:MAG: RHS repeat domain-containing protein [Salinivirgaceae bacterium]